MKNEEYQKMKSAQEAYHSKAMSIPGVHGTSVGIKQVKGELTDTFSICIHLDKKKPLDKIPLDERIPENIEEFPTDIIEHHLPEQVEDNAKYRPVTGGIQIQVESNYGTLGCIVKDRSDNEICALSNQHVLKKEACGVFQPKSDPVCDQIGSTKRVILSSKVDGGITRLNEWDTAYKSTIKDIGEVEGSYDVTFSDLPYPVRKRGRTTRLTKGNVTNINYRTKSSQGNIFNSQLFITPDKNNFADSGDSGSVVVDANNYIVGLLWGAGKNSNPYFGISSPIEDVLSELNIDIVTASMANEAPSPTPYTETFVGKLEYALNQSSKGRIYWQAISKYESHVRHIFHTTPRLYAIWLRIAHSLSEVIVNAVLNPDSKIPSEIGTRDTVTTCLELRDMLIRFVEDDDLKEIINSLCDDIVNNIDLQWNCVFSDNHK